MDLMGMYWKLLYCIDVFHMTSKMVCHMQNNADATWYIVSMCNKNTLQYFTIICNGFLLDPLLTCRLIYTNLI